MGENKTARRLTSGVILIVVLAICLCITSFALVSATVSVENNQFHTGSVRLNLNNGRPVIQEDEFRFEPGMTVVKEFFLENESTWDVYYRLYLDQVAGDLSDVLEITISEGNRILYAGTASELSRQNAAAAENTLAVGQRRTFTIAFHFPEERGNEAQGRTLTFRLCADGTQTKNNPDKLFQ